MACESRRIMFGRVAHARRGALIALLLLSFGSTPAAASENVTVASLPLNIHVIIRGTTTLDPDVVAQLTGIEEKPTISAAEIKKRLETSNLFSFVQVQRSTNFVYIRVRQKFTLFVLPYVTKDSTGSYYSIAAGKQIVFGEDALVVAHYQVGTSDHEGVAIVRDGAVIGSPFLTEFAIGYEDALHWIYQQRDIVSQTVNQYHGGHLELGYRFYPYDSLHLVNYVEQHRFQEINDTYFSGLQWSSLFAFTHDRFYTQEGLSTGWRLKFSYEQTNPLSDFQFWRAKITPEIAPFRSGSINWVIHGDSSFSPSLPRYQKAELGGAKLRGYEPEEFRDRYYGVIQNDLFLTSSSFWHLNLRTFTFADWGFVDSSGRPGFGGGIQIYPKSVAISAFQFYLGYGLNPPGLSSAISFGQQF